MPQSDTNSPTPKKPPRVGTLVGALLVFSALLFDGIQFLVGLVPVLDVALLPLVGIMAFIVLSIFLLFVDPGLLTGPKAFSRQATLGGMSVSSLIPFWDMLPELTAGMLLILALSRAEDAGVSFTDLVKTGLNIAKNPVLGTAEAVVSAKSKEGEKKGGGGVGSFMANRVGGDRKAVGKPLPQDGVRRAKGYAGPTINKEPVTPKQTPLVSGGKPSPLVSEANRWR